MVSLATEISVHPCIFYLVVNAVFLYFFYCSIALVNANLAYLPNN